MDPPPTSDVSQHSLLPPSGPEQKGPQRYEPGIIKPRAVAVTTSLLLGLAIGLEVATIISSRNDGFPISNKNALSPGFTRVITAFFPTLAVAALLFLWRRADRAFREFQPYIMLAQGNTSVDALLLNYIGLRPFSALAKSFKNKHFLVLISATTTLVASLLQPLAGSILQIRQLQGTRDTTASSIRSIGLNPDIGQLDAFLAAAGFAQAAVFHSLPDPPFVRDGWAIAEFEIPTEPGFNGSFAVNTAAIQTTANCSKPASSDLNTSGTNNFTIRATSSQGCTHLVNFDSSTANDQYGVVNIPDCLISTSIEFQPVMFWYFHHRDNGTAEAKSVFCSPTIKALNVIATVNLNDGSLANVTEVDEYLVPNNVTGKPLSGQAFNGVAFNASNNSFVQARSVSISSGVPEAVFRFASQLQNGPQSAFDDSDGFLNITQEVYTQHLAISAKAIYFVSIGQTLSAKMTSFVPRLWVEPISAHALAFLLFAMGLTTVSLNVVHARRRRNIFLTSQPGSIAHAISLTSRSGFGEALSPFDDEEGIKRKLLAMRFHLDRQTGAILSDEHGGPHLMEEDASTISLLGQGSR